MGREFEKKYAASSQVQEAIAAAFPALQSIRMETSYFDTPNGALSARHMTLRLRRENELTICTLKTPLPDGSRGEWECHADTIDDGIRQLLRLGAPEILAQLTAGGVVLRCGARFTRRMTQIATSDGQAELALDQGVLLGGGRELPLCEVEVELKSGSEAACLAFAADLAARFALSEEPRSKFSRANALAQGE